MGGGTRLRHLEELALIQEVRDPGARPDLRITELAHPERFPDQRQTRQCMGDPYLLPCGHEIEPTVHIEPMRTARDLVMAPRSCAIELANELDQPVFGTMDVRTQRHDLGTERGSAHSDDRRLDGRTVSRRVPY